jgi:hypothetical protein
MSDTTIKFIKSICPNLTQVEAVLAAQRLDVFNGFLSDVRAWRESLPPNQRIIPKPIQTKFTPYLIK